MIFCSRHVAAVLLVLLAVADGAETARSAGAIAAGAGLAANLQPFLDRNVIAGAVVFVADGDKTLDFETVGYSNLQAKTPMAADSLFWIASMTKSITATAFMTLVDEGKVNLNDPVAKFLPTLKELTVVDPETKSPRHPAKNPMLIRHLLTHTSGLSEDPLPHRSLQDDADVVARRPLQSEPGARYKYNNAGINSAARIIELLSGKSYASFVQERFFDPLKMKDTTFWPNAEQASRLAKTHRLNSTKTGLEILDFNQEAIRNPNRTDGVPSPILSQFGGMIPTYANRFADAAGGLFSTPGDIGTFCQMLLNEGTFRGRRYLSVAAIRQMASLQTGDIPVNPRGGFGHEGYGLGWTVHRPDDDPTGPGFGHLGARKTMMWIDSTHQVVMGMFVQIWQISRDDQQKLYAAFIGPALETFGRKRTNSRNVGAGPPPPH